MPTSDAEKSRDDLIAELAELRARSTLADQVAESLGEGVYAVDPSGNLRLMNPVAERLLGWSQGELVGRNMHAAIHHTHQDGTPFPEQKCPLMGVLRTGNAARIERDAFVRKDGTFLPVMYVSTPVVAEGAVTGAVIAFHDISARLHDEIEHADLLAREQMARAEAEAANEHLGALQSITDSALAYLAPDDLLRAVLPLVREAIGADTAAALLVEEDGDALMVRAAHGLGASALEGVRIPVELRPAERGHGPSRRQLDDLSRLDLGPFFPDALALVAGVPLRVERRALGVLAVGASDARAFSRDDTRMLHLVADRVALALDRAQAYQSERKARTLVEEIADQLLRQAAELDTIIEAIPGGVIVCDREGRVVRVNAHATSRLGGGAVGREHRTLLGTGLRHPNGDALMPEDYPLARALRGETAADLRLLLERPEEAQDATELLVSYAPLRAPDGGIAGAVCTTTDITAISRLERQKDEFLSVASHELKTPLTSLKILAQLTHRRLAKAGIPEAEQLIGMERSIGRMEMLVNDLLDVSRIEGGKLALRMEESDMVALCRQVAEEQMAAAERPVTLDLPDEPMPVRMDPERIAQVLVNLLSNALKYAPVDCEVTLRTWYEGASVVVAVRDDGVGIPPEHQGHLFERFYRVPGVQVQTGSGVGMGLGLYISREIVERHGGRIWVESQVGTGTTFLFSLPVGRP